MEGRRRRGDHVSEEHQTRSGIQHAHGQECSQPDYGELQLKEIAGRGEQFDFSCKMFICRRMAEG